MHYIIGSGFKAQEDGGLIRLFHKATVEAPDVSVATSKAEIDAPRATPIRALPKIPPTARYPNLRFDSRGRLLVTRKKKTKFLVGFGLLVTALIGYVVYICNTALIDGAGCATRALGW